MNTPFTAEQFLEIFKNYNQDVFPLQVVFYLLSFIAVYLTFRPTEKSDKIISGLLAFFWMWMGVVYHLFYFTEINIAAYLFGVIFILQSILLLTFGVFQNKLTFVFRSDGYGITGIILILFALIIYPVLGYLFGHVYPNSPTFGLPCPTTIFTFGLLLICDKKCPIIILIIPFVWSVIGFTAAFNFGIVEDIGLLISGLLTITLILVRNRIPAKKNTIPSESTMLIWNSDAESLKNLMSKGTKKYYLVVRDNFNLMDPSDTYEFGDFETYDEALIAAKKMVDEFLEGAWKPGMSSGDLLLQFHCHGESPIIVSSEPEDPVEQSKQESFSAHIYAGISAGNICRKFKNK